MSRRGMRGSRRVTVFAAALLGAAVGAGFIAGCSSSDEPEPQTQQEPDKKQEPAPDPETTEEPEPDEPELPDKLDGPHVRAVLQYYDEYNKATRSGNTDNFLALATDDCGSCEGLADRINEVFSGGGRYEGSMDPVIDEEKNLARLGDDTANVTLRFRHVDFAIYPKEGAEPLSPDEEFIDMHVNLVREGEQWLISEVTSEPVTE